MKTEEKKRVVFLRGKKVILRPLCKETDLEKCVSWLNDPEVSKFLKVFGPITKQAEMEWFDSLSKKENDVILAIETTDGEYIGNIGLHRINWTDRTATTGAFIGIKEYWGKGYGTDAKMILLSYAFNTLNLRKITSSVIAFNKRSLHYSLHCGYKIEGRKRKQMFCNGKYWDEIILGLFKEEWLPIWKKYKKAGKIR